MIDKNLLELAAKAAGIELRPNLHPTRRYLLNGNEWNPLTDDGDALRLAVKLWMSVSPDIGATFECVVAHVDGSYFAIEKSQQDPYAATRRAIVRTAAEIGKDM